MSAVGLVALIAVSCAGHGTDAAGPPVAEGGLPREVCALVSQLERTEDRINGPGVFELDAELLDHDLAARREVLDNIADLASGDLGRRLRRQVRSQRAFDDAVVARWDERRGEIAAAPVDGSWAAQVLDEVVRRPDGVEVDVHAFLTLSGDNVNELVVRCRAPEAVGLPEQETDEDPPPGRLVYVGWDADAGRNRLVGDLGGGPDQPIGDLGPWQVLAGLDAAPAGDRVVAVIAGPGDEFALAVADRSGALLGVTARGPRDLTCPDWDPAGGRIVALDNTADAGERRLHLVAPDGGGAGPPLDLPFAVGACAAFLGPDRLVVSDAATTVWTVGLDGSDPRRVYAPERCATLVGDVDPAETRVSVSQLCRDPAASGLWVVDLATGGSTHVVTANVGPAKWSPDGTWLVFGLYPLVGDHTSTVWAARADGHQLRQITDRPSFTPVWLPAD